MPQLPQIFTVVFVTTAGVSIMFGTYLLRVKSIAQENRVFFACTIALAVWALGLGMALSAPEMQASVIWRRIASLGWAHFSA